MKLKTLLLSFCLACGLSGCITVDSVFGEVDPQISSVELEALQTREYEASLNDVFAATVGAFQSYGFSVQSADRTTGLVIAKTTSDATLDSFTGLARVQYDKATAFIEPSSAGHVKIRISIVKYVSASAMGSSGEKEAVRTKPKVYQDLFSKIEQSLFLRKNL